MGSIKCPHCQKKVLIEGEGTYECPHCRTHFKSSEKKASVVKQESNKKNSSLDVVLWIILPFFLLFGLVVLFSSFIGGILIIISSLTLLPPILKKVSKKSKLRLRHIFVISALFFVTGFIVFGFSLPDEEVEDNEVLSEQDQTKTQDISKLLNDTKALINSFNENLITASNYNINTKEYQDITKTEITDNSPYEEVEELHNKVKQYNSELETSINEAKNKSYPVTGVIDGDTIKITYEGVEETVRLIGMDTPETVHPSKPVQCFGEEASNKIKELVEGKSVSIMFDNTQGMRDKYGRLLLYIWTDDVFVNKKMIVEGYAHEYTYSTPYLYQDEFKAAENQAREDKTGLWGDVCACDKKELSRKCTSCNIKTITYQNWDCSKSTETVTDTSCTTGCVVNTPPSSPSPTPTPTPTPSPSYNTTTTCCKVCREGKACGDSCISASLTCHQPPGCACNAY